MLQEGALKGRVVFRGAGGRESTSGLKGRQGRRPCTAGSSYVSEPAGETVCLGLRGRGGGLGLGEQPGPAGGPGGEQGKLEPGMDMGEAVSAAAPVSEK